MKTVDEERYIFRCIEQRNTEPIASFVERLQFQIEKCTFSVDEVQQRLKEQIIEKCSNKKLRQISFQIEMNIEKLIAIATILEGKSDSTSQECIRCGFKDHNASDLNCPARRGHGCELCGKYGHYARMCFQSKSKLEERKSRLERPSLKRTLSSASEELGEKGKKVCEESVEIPRPATQNRVQKESALNDLPSPSTSCASTQIPRFQKGTADTNIKHKRADNGVIHIDTCEVKNKTENKSANSAPKQACFDIDQR